MTENARPELLCNLTLDLILNSWDELSAEKAAEIANQVSDADQPSYEHMGFWSWDESPSRIDGLSVRELIDCIAYGNWDDEKYWRHLRYAGANEPGYYIMCSYTDDECKAECLKVFRDNVDDHLAYYGPGYLLDIMNVDADDLLEGIDEEG